MTIGGLYDVKQIFQWCLDHWAFTAFVLAAFVQFTPAIKLDPLTWLFRLIGRWVNAEVMKEIEVVKATQQEQQTAIDENEKDRVRFEVLDFANSCRNKRKHTKDEFEHIIVLNSKYEKLLEKTGDTNGVFTAEFEYIMELYRQCQREDTFL